LEILPEESFGVSFGGGEGNPMFYKLLCFSLMLTLVLLLVGIGGAICVGTVLLVLFRLIVEVRRGDKADDLLERVLWIPPDKKVYES
jgi:hypothetical protein